MEKVLMVFPCGRNEIPYVNYLLSAKRYRKIFIVLVGINKDHIDIPANNRNLKVVSIKEWMEAYIKSDIIWIPQGRCDKYLHDQIDECTKCAERDGKLLFDEGKEKVEDISRGKETEPMYQPNATVIAIGECFENFNGADLICRLSSYFISAGFKTKTLINRNLKKITGFDCIPNDINSDSIAGANKIVLWNRLIRGLDEHFAPDVLLIQVPGGMLHPERKTMDYFGLRAYYLFQAILPDVVFLTLPANMAEEKIRANLNEDFAVRYNIQIDRFFLSKHLVDFELLQKNRDVGNKYVDKTHYRNILIKSGKQIGDIWDNYEMESILHQIKTNYLTCPFELITFQL